MPSPIFSLKSVFAFVHAAIFVLAAAGSARTQQPVPADQSDLLRARQRAARPEAKEAARRGSGVGAGSAGLAGYAVHDFSPAAAEGEKSKLDELPPELRAEISRKISEYEAKSGVRPSALAAPLPYPFYPHAGNVGQDLIIGNYADLSFGAAQPTGRDWGCGTRTYPGHGGHDVLIRTFREQDIGVPIFSALDGVVVDWRDGFPDRNMSCNNNGAFANYVILDHGGQHYTLYFHMRAGSVAPAARVVGNFLRAGTQLGLTGSSGCSTQPHLHFETWVGGNGSQFPQLFVREPFAGPCNGFPTGWVQQQQHVRHELYVRDSAFSTGGFGSSMADYLNDLNDRVATFAQSSQLRNISFKLDMANLPPETAASVGVVRPDGQTISFPLDSWQPPFHAYSVRWWVLPLTLNTTGTWVVQVFLFGPNIPDGVFYHEAYFNVVSSAAQVVNRAPFPVTATLTPNAPTANDAIFCRVRDTFLDFRDPDYDIVRYRYQWVKNGATIRNVVTAALADAIPKASAANGDSLSCTITPMDDNTSGPPATASIRLGATTSTLQLEAASYTVGEGGTAVVNVLRTDNISNSSTVDIVTSNGTATAGQDYVSSSQVLTFEPGQTSRSILIRTTDDQTPEPAETINLTISRPTGGATLGSRQTAVLTITDNDACTYQLSQAARNSPASGEPVTVTVTAAAGCAWTAASNSSFITVNSGASGSGNGPVTFSVAANPNSTPRTGTLTIAGLTYTVTQAGLACSYQVSPPFLPTFPASGGQGSFQMIAPAGCAWTAQSLAPWIVVTQGAGTGNGTVNFTVAPNVGQSRVGQIVHTSDSFYAVSQAAGSGSTFNLQTAAASRAESGGRAEIVVLRLGDAAAPASVTFQTVDDPAAVRCDDTAARPGVAFARCDYATTVETLTWAAGDSQPKTVAIPLIDDAHVEGPESVLLQLTSPQGGAVGPTGTSTLTITDNDSAPGPNPILQSPFFVRMQYLDFLSREPEAGEPWTGVLARCPDVNNDTTCGRILVSKSFFESPEFQLKGRYVFLFYKAAFGRLPEYSEIVSDMRSVTGQTEAEVFQKRALYAQAFAQRAEFTRLYGQMTQQQFVDALLGRYGLQQITTEDTQNPEGTAQTTLTRQQLTSALTNGTLTRAQALRAVVQSSEVDATEYNGAFVAMQYYGYLRRTPEPGGYDAWLRVIGQNPSNVNAMIDGFMNSQEYRLRFGQP